jgi:hypothetical protein
MARAHGEGVVTQRVAREAQQGGAAVHRLEAALAEARRPWLARVLEGLRRKRS